MCGKRRGQTAVPRREEFHEVGCYLKDQFRALDQRLHKFEALSGARGT